MRLLRRLLLGLLVLLAALCGAGALVQALAEAAERRAYPPPGRLIDVGGHRLHINCLGQGSPTVVLDHVGAANSAQWALIQPRLAAGTRVCAYDRAGFGWSDRAAPGSRDGQTAVRELHTLLTNAGERGPFVLVGHSYGGRIAKLYAATYPRQVAGMLLVDPGIIWGHPTVAPEIDAQWRAESRGLIASAPVMARLGLMRLANRFGADGGTGELGPAERAAYYSRANSARFWDAIAAEYAALPQTSAQELAVKTLDDLPLLVLSAGQPSGAGRAAWTAINAGTAALSSRGRHRTIDGAAHMSFAWQEQYAGIVVDAVVELLATLQAGR